MPSEPLRANVAFSDAGLPQGTYRLYNASQTLQASGQFEAGHRSGVWTFWDSRGVKIVELTYAQGLKQGPCLMWYGFFAFPGAARRQKLEAHFSGDLQDGTTRTWFPNGSRRCEADLNDGMVIDAQCWSEDGSALTPDEALDVARRQLTADTEHLRILDEVVADSLRDARSAGAPPTGPLPPAMLRQ